MRADYEKLVKTNVQFLSAVEAIRKVPESATIMVGGFGITGIPQYLLQILVDKSEVRNLTIISNNINTDTNLYPLFKQNRISKVIGTYFTTNKELVKAHRKGQIRVELLPQGTFSEAIRLGGSGIPAFYTPTSVGTELAKNKETRFFNGREHVLEESLHADVSLIKAYKADKAGNLIYRKTARNFNPVMAMAADLTIVEVEEVVEIGELDPEAIITPFPFVDIIVKKEGIS
ncbi:CoA transferase subunit A [Pseudogracilibacillus auburnensis]|uniref:CoA transferase subunit A n=1 Tax=Pseudogracilibacillus auburnensis TaxID=1494959 RepID=UPI001A964616|nr:3-oxoacid CoA-transferase subunit A [Pseudogracilibacillus auburnensis]MBO1003189.1 3-oxoacid CoA-transferase subunit A [Pseudogracilibacillus auburnensis]